MHVVFTSDGSVTEPGYQAKIHVLGIPKFPCTTFSDFLKNAEVWYRALVVVTLDNDESQSIEQFRVFMEEGRETTLLQTNCVKSRI